VGAVAAIAHPGPPPSRSERMTRLLEVARRVAQTDANVLLTGESGTGKGSLARYLHDASPRSAGPFVTITCATIPGELLESELFGHEKGAFTGAVDMRRGRFEQAHGGTILIDGVSELAPALQGKLLRVVQEKAFERLAGTSTIEVDTRIVSSTQVDLELLVASGQFRGDLYYRLNVIRLDLPPLRERLEDLPDLAEAMLREIAGSRGGEPLRLSPGALDRLAHHDWPGNLRELRNVLERALLFGEGGIVEAHELPVAAEAAPASPPAGDITLAAAERRHIESVLHAEGRSVEQAARVLGLSRSALYDRIRKHGIRLPHR
jgi:DNA-binding NtrC family response regulator